jgi:hypothetical protein
MTVDELRALLADLPGDARITVRHDYRFAPVTSALFIEDHPCLAFSADLASVESRLEQLL